MDVSIIVPIYNEEENIKELVEHLETRCAKTKFSVQIIFVDDGSSDKSIDILKEQKYSSFEAKLVKLSKNFGSHNAIRAGVMNADANICTFFSADLQEPFEVIENMYDKIMEGQDLVCAYKEQVQIKKSEKIFSNLYSRLIRKFAIKNFPVEGVNNVMFNYKIKDRLNKNVEKNSSIFLQIMDMGFKKTFIPYSLNKRKHGKSKWSFAKKIKLFIDSFVNFSYVPIRAVSISGMLMSILSAIIAIFIIIYKIFINNTMPLGYPTILIVLLLGFGITNISIGIVSEYIWRTLDTVRERPTFIIDEIENL